MYLFILIPSHSLHNKLREMLFTFLDDIPHPEAKQPLVQFIPISSSSADSKEGTLVLGTGR